MKYPIYLMETILFVMLAAPVLGETQKKESGQGMDPWAVVAVEDAKTYEVVTDPDLIAELERQSRAAIKDDEERDAINREKLELLNAIERLPNGTRLAGELAKIFIREQKLRNRSDFSEGVKAGYKIGYESGHYAGFIDGGCNGFLVGTDALLDNIAELNRDDFKIIKEGPGQCDPKQAQNASYKIILPGYRIHYYSIESLAAIRPDLFSAVHIPPISEGSSSPQSQPYQYLYRDPYLQNPPEDVNLRLRQEYYQRLLVDQVRQLNMQLFRQSLPSLAVPAPILNAPRFQRP